MRKQVTKKDVDGYIKEFPKEEQMMLNKMRSIIRKVAPKAEEVMSYNMPAYKYHGMLVYFAANKNHIGLYPMPSAVIKFKKELSKYKTAKSTIQFPTGEKLPVSLITKIIKFRASENLKKSIK
jgi:uncharacterized protein YdhG (YjbR/CyaY superfamily)